MIGLLTVAAAAVLAWGLVEPWVMARIDERNSRRALMWEIGRHVKEQGNASDGERSGVAWAAGRGGG